MHQYHIGNTGLQSQVLQSFKALFSICIIFVRTGPLAEGILEGDVSLAGALHAFLITGEEAKPSKRKKSERERECVTKHVSCSALSWQKLKMVLYQVN